VLDSKSLLHSSRPSNHFYSLSLSRLRQKQMSLPAAGAGGGSGGSGGVEVSTWSGAAGFVLPLSMKWPNDSPASELLKGSAAALGRSDFTLPLQVLEKHWVESVGDLRLLVQEGMLRSIGLPVRLCVWLEDELGRASVFSASGGATPAAAPGSGAISPVAVARGTSLGAGAAGLVDSKSLAALPAADYKQNAPPPLTSALSADELKPTHVSMPFRYVSDMGTHATVFVLFCAVPLRLLIPLALPRFASVF
jgi:hypothetical protein